MTAHGLGPTRARVLGLLQSAGDPLSVNQVAEQLEMHRNSVRFHLDALVEKGYVAQSVASTGVPGRPPLHYTATADSPTISNMHMAEMVEVLLHRFVAPSPDPESMAIQAGRDWGLRVVEDDPDAGDGDTLTDLARYFGHRGFTASSRDDALTFTRCPFRGNVDDEVMPLICAMHRGFVEGYLEVSGSPEKLRHLTPGDEVCTVVFERPAGSVSE